MSSTSGGRDPLPVDTLTYTHQTRSFTGKRVKEKEDFRRTCLGIKRATADGGHFCGIQKRGSFSVEQGAVGVSTLFLSLSFLKMYFSESSVELPPTGIDSVGVGQMFRRHTGGCPTLSLSLSLLFFLSLFFGGVVSSVASIS